MVSVLLAVPALFLALLRAIPGFDLQWFWPDSHLVVVSAIAACALFVAAVAVLSATHSPQSGVVWLGLGCSIVGVFMLGHGLTTPGALHQPTNEWVARLPYFAMAGFATCLVIAGTHADRAVNRCVGGHPLLTVMLVMTPATIFVAQVVVDPSSLHGTSAYRHENTVFAFASTAIILGLAVVLWRHGKRWHLGKDPIQLALVLAADMSIAAVVAFEHGKFTHLSWWDYQAMRTGSWAIGMIPAPAGFSP